MSEIEQEINTAYLECRRNRIKPKYLVIDRKSYLKARADSNYLIQLGKEFNTCMGAEISILESSNNEVIEFAGNQHDN